MSHVVDATYENGILKLDQPLPLKDREKVRVTVENLSDVSVAFPSKDPAANSWTVEDNERRCDLIDKHIEGAISESEKRELDQLQSQMREHLDRIAPMPMEGALRLHQQLLNKKRDAECQTE
jgi:predicted DNA-binding antitoxin AbrB/MazE fold protein